MRNIIQTALIVPATTAAKDSKAVPLAQAALLEQPLVATPECHDQRAWEVLEEECKTPRPIGTVLQYLDPEKGVVTYTRVAATPSPELLARVAAQQPGEGFGLLLAAQLPLAESVMAYTGQAEGRCWTGYVLQVGGEYGRLALVTEEGGSFAFGPVRVFSVMPGLGVEMYESSYIPNEAIIDEFASGFHPVATEAFGSLYLAFEGVQGVGRLLYPRTAPFGCIGYDQTLGLPGYEPYDGYSCVIPLWQEGEVIAYLNCFDRDYGCAFSLYLRDLAGNTIDSWDLSSLSLEQVFDPRVWRVIQMALEAEASLED